MSRRPVPAIFLALIAGLFFASANVWPNEAHAQSSCSLSTPITTATNSFNFHRQNPNGNLASARVFYRLLITFGVTSLPQWTGTNISGPAPTTTISAADVRTFSAGNSWRHWNDTLIPALVCLELPAITISGGTAVTEGTAAVFTLTASPVPTTSLTINLTVSESGDAVASDDKGTGKTVTLGTSGTATYTVPTVDDTTLEADGSIVTVTVTSGTGYRLGSPFSAMVTVSDDDKCNSSNPCITVTGGSPVTEGPGVHAVFTVHSDPDPSANLPVTVAIGEQCEFVAPGDLGIKTITINSGQTSATHRVPIVNDNDEESKATSGDNACYVSAEIRSVVGDGYQFNRVSTMGRLDPQDHIAEIIVIDDDNFAPPPPAQPTVTISADATPVTEGTVASFTVTASPPSTSALTVNLNVTEDRTQGRDFVANSNLGPKTVTIPANQSSATHTVPTVGDSTDEPNGSVTVTVDSGTGYIISSTSGSATVAVNDDDGPAEPAASFDAASSSAAESAGTRNVTVNLSSAAPSGGLTVGYGVTGTATAGSGNDFTIQGSGTVTVAAGATSANIPVAILDDSTNEPAETVILTLTGGTGYTVGSPSVHTLTISDNDNPQPGTPALVLSRNTLSVSEGSTGSYTVRLATEPTGTVTVNIASNNADVTIDPAPLTFHASGNTKLWNTAQTVTVSAAQDTDANNDSATLTHTAVGGGYSSVAAASVTVTVTDGDPGTTDPPGEGNGGNGNNDEDGEDENDQDGEDQDPTPGTPVVAFAADTSRPREDAGPADVPVTFAPAPAAALTVHYTVTGTATAGRDFTALTGAVTVSAGASRVTIPVGLTDDRMDEGAETVILTLTAGEGYTLGTTRVHTLTITDNDTAGLRASPSTVHLAEAGEQATVSVHLTAQPTAPVTVTFASSQGRVATVTPATLRFTPATWQTPQAVTLTAGADGVATLRGTVQSTDRGYAALASGALPPIRVRVGADLTGLTTPWLARFGRTVTSQAVTGVTARLAAARTPGLTGTVAGLALDRMGEAAAPATTRLALAPSDPRLNPGGQPLTLRDILAGSAFALTSDPSATGGSYALWGQGAWTRFAGQAGAQDVEGNVLSGTLGVDWAQGAWVLGVAVSHTQGDGDAAQTTAQGDLASSLTLVTPYVGVDITEHLSLWGTMGYGRGTVGLTLPTASEVETDLSLFLVAGGVRERLLEPASTGGLAVAVRSEARFLRTMADAETAQGLAESEADVGLLRVGLESSWQQPLADGGAVVPRLDLGFRQDLGEAETGVGLEVQGGVRWEAPAHGLTLDVAGQTLLAHSDQEFETWGGSATVQWAANPTSATGPALTLRQTYGGAAGAGANTFWTENPVALLQAPGPAELRLTADFGWGVPLRTGLGMPHVQYGWAPTSRDIALGWRLLPTRASEMTLELTATHREAVRTAPVQGVALSLTRQW